MKTNAQTKLIKKQLEYGVPLTPLKALDYFGCLRLSARIYDLRKKGMDIKARIITTNSGKRVSEYYI
jgi:hypothetical protein